MRKDPAKYSISFLNGNISSQAMGQPVELALINDIVKSNREYTIRIEGDVLPEGAVYNDNEGYKGNYLTFSPAINIYAGRADLGGDNSNELGWICDQFFAAGLPPECMQVSIKPIFKGSRNKPAYQPIIATIDIQGSHQ